MKKRLAYTAYIVLVTVFFLYYLFPGDAVTSYINYEINKQSPEVQVSIKKLRPEFPPGIQLVGTDLMLRNQALVGADYLNIRPAYLSLFASEKSFVINGDMYDGKLSSAVRVSDMTKNPTFDIDAAFTGIRLDKVPSIQTLGTYRVSGVADGNIIYENTDTKGGKGNADITVTDSAVKFTPALFGIEQLTFNTVKAEFDIMNQRVTLKQLEVDSREVSGTASGTMIIRNPVTRSTINIRGELKPHPGFIKQLSNIIPMDMISRRQSKTGGIPFRITGSLERPNFNFR